MKEAGQKFLYLTQTPNNSKNEVGRVRAIAFTDW